MGQMVRVRGAGSLDRRGRVRRLLDGSSVKRISAECLQVREARSDKTSVTFVRPLQAVVTEEENVVAIRIPELGLHEYGESLEEAIDAMNDELVFLWEEYASAEPATLTEDALELRETLLGMAFARSQ